MIDLKEQVRDALAGACADVVYGYPRDRAGRRRIAWRESANRRYAQADGREYLAELNYAVEIFAETSEDAAALTAEVDARMARAGLRRESAAEQFERDAGVCHVSARYRALADAAGNIYQ